MRNFNENTKKNVNCEHMKGDAIRYLNKIALNIGDTNITLYEHLEEEYINFRKITGELTDKLAEIGVSLFIILNESGWGDMPSDTISDLEDEISCDLYSSPMLIGNLIVEAETVNRNIYCSHFNIKGNVKRNLITICNNIIGENFRWDGSQSSAILLKF